MKNYDSLYTGKQIDDAVGAVYGFSKSLDKINNEIDSVKNTYLSKNEAADYYVKKLGSTGEYKVYMSSPDGKDASRTIATAPIGSSVPIRTQEGHILLPDASVSMPAPNEAISAGVADDLYGLDRKTKDFHPTTTLRWLNNSDQREMVINGSWIGFYKDGKQTTLLYPDKFTLLFNFKISFINSLNLLFTSLYDSPFLSFKS